MCGIFAKLNKFNISMEDSDKNMLDASDRIAVFVKKLSLWKEDIANVSESSQCFTFIWTNIQIKRNIRVVFFVLSSITCRQLWCVFSNILLLVRRKSSKLFQRRHNEKSSRTTDLGSCTGKCVTNVEGRSICINIVIHFIFEVINVVIHFIFEVMVAGYAFLSVSPNCLKK